MCCPLWMHPPDVDLLVRLHPTQSESVLATTFSDSFWYLYQFTTLGYRTRYLPSLTNLFQASLVGDVTLLVASFCGECDVHPVVPGNSPYPPVSCHLLCAQDIANAVDVNLVSELATQAALCSNFVSSPPQFHVPLPSRLVLIQPSLGFSAPVSRLILSACLGSASHVIPLRGCHLTIRFSTLVSLAWSSSSPIMVIVSNVFLKPLHNHSSSVLSPDDMMASS